MDKGVDFDLKMDKVPMDDIHRDDLVFKNGAIWVCASKATNTFINMENREKIELNDENLPKLKKLELIPQKWEVN